MDQYSYKYGTGIPLPPRDPNVSHVSYPIPDFILKGIKNPQAEEEKESKMQKRDPVDPVLLAKAKMIHQQYLKKKAKEMENVLQKQNMSNPGNETMNFHVGKKKENVNANANASGTETEVKQNLKRKNELEETETKNQKLEKEDESRKDPKETMTKRELKSKNKKSKKSKKELKEIKLSQKLRSNPKRKNNNNKKKKANSKIRTKKNQKELKETAFQTLLRLLGMVEEHNDPESPDYDSSHDDEPVPSGKWL